MKESSLIAARKALFSHADPEYSINDSKSSKNSLYS